jgi:hypothetical protein
MSMEKIKRIGGWAIGIFFGWASVAAAGQQPLTLPNPLGCGSLGCATNSIINLIYTVAVPLCAIMVLIGGFQIMTSSGNPEKLSQGRSTILWAAGGFAVILLAKGVAGLVRSFF